MKHELTLFETRPVVDATGAKILAHRDAKDQIPDMDIGLQAGDVVKVGKTVELESLDTPVEEFGTVALPRRVSCNEKIRVLASMRSDNPASAVRPPGIVCHRSSRTRSIRTYFSRPAARAASSMPL